MRCTEVLDMVLWMREFNQSGKGRIEFTGFDMQTPDVAAGIVKDFVASADPGYMGSVTSALHQIENFAPGPSFGIATATFPIKDAIGKRVRLSVQVDGTQYLAKTDFDLDFESSTPKGFNTAGKGYMVEPDSKIFP
jgi:hypothetical protein